MRLAVVRFPGSNCEEDVATVLARDLGRRVEVVDHRRRDLRPFAGVVLPGGFAFGDYLRAGALAARTPVMEAVRDFAAAGGPVLGICNGFQILCEAGLLPGALRPNRQLRFQCRPVWLRVEGPSALTAGLPPGRILRMEIAHGEGAYVGDGPRGTLVPGRGARVILRYVDAAGRAVPAANPNGSADNVAGICNAAGNVVGLMPHPERRPAEGPGRGALLPAGAGDAAGSGDAPGAAAPVRAAMPGRSRAAVTWDGLDLLARWAEGAEAWWTLRRAGSGTGRRPAVRRRAASPGVAADRSGTPFAVSAHLEDRALPARSEGGAARVRLG
ncbi:phosphoribosylformylglycinamidine synthase I [Thermaerobacter marianensis DSM 12885]|uniref:Phosphoribosylformylglycinamidine synthase subunit PurQ n=1 Tax=Thermaerobacter marianensis (strain ATCC 700841 / DSM 12885 / JCM 10246 / 7p75a) TaxID=644966 RepID=E6SMP4_THEM7|nr:phosphoribosylformylglycinamidine synthase I [Thermaerobacter marianensis]ADU51536.1 phosphoribosylformylglycinamidine synthase I [Thermaerobacter marianensis DSM 12885]